jgi:hypothetical protein
MPMEHNLTFRNEPRYAVQGANRDWSDQSPAGRLKCYPCLTVCKSHQHSGMTTFVYAECSCGWSVIAGESSIGNPILEGRLQHLQHQIDHMGRL